MLTKGKETTDQGQEYYEQRSANARCARCPSALKRWECNSSPSSYPPENHLQKQPLRRCFLKGVAGDCFKKPPDWKKVERVRGAANSHAK